MNQYLYETMCHYLSGNGHLLNSRANMIIKIPLIFYPWHEMMTI